jgi:hypothetical protein
MTHLTDNEFKTLIPLEETMKNAKFSGFLRNVGQHEFKALADIYNRLAGMVFYTTNCSGCAIELYSKMYDIFVRERNERATKVYNELPKSVEEPVKTAEVEPVYVQRKNKKRK